MMGFYFSSTVSRTQDSYCCIASLTRITRNSEGVNEATKNPCKCSSSQLAPLFLPFPILEVCYNCLVNVESHLTYFATLCMQHDPNPCSSVLYATACLSILRGDAVLTPSPTC